MVVHNKLVRDKIPEIIEKAGKTPVTPTRKPSGISFPIRSSVLKICRCSVIQKHSASSKSSRQCGRI